MGSDHNHPCPFIYASTSCFRCKNRKFQTVSSSSSLSFHCWITCTTSAMRYFQGISGTRPATTLSGDSCDSPTNGACRFANDHVCLSKDKPQRNVSLASHRLPNSKLRGSFFDRGPDCDLSYFLISAMHPSNQSGTQHEKMQPDALVCPACIGVLLSVRQQSSSTADEVGHKVEFERVIHLCQNPSYRNEV